MFGFPFLFWSFRFFLESYGKSDPVNRNMASDTQGVKKIFMDTKIVSNKAKGRI